MSTQIVWKIPYGELVKKNGLKTCLEKVPGTRHWLTHARNYGKIERAIQEQENTLRLNRCSLKELRAERLEQGA